MPKPSTTTIERGRLVEALDMLADVARAIECAADDGRPFGDPPPDTSPTDPSRRIRPG